jgi:uracil-DNA glycosylase
MSELMHPTWASALAPQESTLRIIGGVLRQRLAAGESYQPTGDQILRAFAQPLSDVRVLIVGQDPYPTPGNAVGLAFAVPPGTTPMPGSLVNIAKEMSSDLGCLPPADLATWADRGVLLLNRVLTVRPGATGSHRGIGWEEFTAAAVQALVARGGPLVAILWGRDAHTLTALLGDEVPVIASAHPSPLSAHRGFFGSRPFSRANSALEMMGGQPINWCG